MSFKPIYLVVLSYKSQYKFETDVYIEEENKMKNITDGVLPIHKL